MQLKSFFILLIIVSVSSGDYKFPKNFQFGVATGAVQYEGGWNKDGKGENIWDYAIHNNPDKIVNNSNADVTSDGYHKYKEDVQLLKFLGVDFYRFSISWSRILPTGKTDKINQLGINYYKSLINELLNNGIEPHVTMYFWDLPQPLQEEGGWRNEAMIEYFLNYAKILFTHFGDYVKNWITFNEVLSICVHGYETGILAPFLNDTGIGNYECARIVLLAHAKTYNLYSEEFRKEQKGQIGIGLDTPWFEPKDPDNEEDRKATDIALEMTLGWFLHPLIYGNYPERMINHIDTKSKIQRFDKSRLPKFSKTEQKILQNSLDFLGLNYWTTMLIEMANTDLEPIPSFLDDAGVLPTFHPSWSSSAADWLKITPWGLSKLLVWIKQRYNTLPVVIAENGFADKGGLEDRERADYHKNHLLEVLKAIHEDQLDVKSYAAWTLTDNFVWIWSYTQKFGLFSVDFNVPSKTRTAKYSAYFYKNVISSRTVDIDLEWPIIEDKKEEKADNYLLYTVSAIIGVILLLITKLL